MDVMETAKSASSDTTVKPFVFVSYGVKVKVNSNMQEMVDEAKIVAQRSLLDSLRPIRASKIDFLFELRKTGAKYVMIQNGEEIASGRSRRKFFKFFDSMIRASVGERSVDRVFLHAGVVGWKGRAILMPADSFKGKSTLVAELVRQGASYYSDDFAVCDKQGLVHAFPRPISMRTVDGRFREYVLTVKSLGGVCGLDPIPVGLILFTEYDAGVNWDPKLLTAGNGVLELIPYTLTFRHRPELSLQVLNSVASRAIIASSPRGTAKEFAKVILNFVDKNVN